MTVTMRIDTRYCRFNIHRKAISAIGDPPFIKFGYTARTRELGVSGVWTDDMKSIRVRYNEGGSFYICSKGLLEGIRSEAGALLEEGSYLLEGEAAGTEIRFPLTCAHLLPKEAAGPAGPVQEGGLP